ncbi:MAG: glycoside hydrolase [Lachnospiraceae bacterium]|nr:glycoside hydrolase [Lachnospiraceae bacterium]
MNKRLEEALAGKPGNYILPFFWQHGEDAEMLIHYLHAIHDCGIGAVCVESRPHPDFAGDGWWRDLDVIMQEAKALDMKVWVLDDAHFPTGYCNGQVKSHPEYGKIYLDHYVIDAKGPLEEASFLLQVKEDEEVIGVVAARRSTTEVGKLKDAVDLSDAIRGSFVYWSVPEGNWNIIVIKQTPHGPGREAYCNLIDKDAVRFLIDTVYEPHYQKYAAEFGETFAGFFSDEPELGNTFGDSEIGQSVMELPWCRELSDRLTACWPKDRAIFLAALWSRISGYTQKSRYDYMEQLTRLFQKNYSEQIGEWCAAHHVEYIGHVIEDNGKHTRTGYGAGHFFRALWGQHMSGIDVVLQQIRPGLSDRDFYHISGKETYDGIFFHFALAKLGASLALYDEKKKGRTMCELYGAYGWSEGLKLMKWIADHMLVRGINWFVPHAFTPAPFPDPDCPPHFYAHGQNPQYPWFGDLMRYMNRMSHLLNGGTHHANVAVLYSAELEWIGRCETVKYVCKVLAEHQIDYDILPAELVDTPAAEGYRALIIPDCEAIDPHLAARLKTAAASMQIIFAGTLPTVLTDQWEASANLSLGQCCCDQDPERLLAALDALEVREIRIVGKVPDLRYFHYVQEDTDFYLFFDEIADVTARMQVALQIKDVSPTDHCFWYHGWENCLEEVTTDAQGRILLNCAPYETTVLCIEHAGQAAPVSPRIQTSADAPVKVEINGPWKITLRDYRGKEVAADRITLLCNITGAHAYPEFSGTMCYETTFEWDGALGECADLDCGMVYETLEVSVNGVKQAVRIAPPYCCRLHGLTDGTNTLRLLVANTLVHALKDPLSATMPIEPSGLFGPVVIR